MEFLKIYRTVKDVFVKPKLKWYFGTWKKEPNLPIWRRGPEIRLSKKFSWSSKNGDYYCPDDNVLVFEGYADHEFQGVPVKKYGRSYHKLPGGLTSYSRVWNRNIRKKLRKWHLSWIPPVIQLPLFFTFHFWDDDIMYKTKWSEDDYRYEFPAHITLVFFGLAISVTAIIPQVNKWTSTEDYWESLLTYRHYKDISKVDKIMGSWRSLKDGKEEYRRRLNPEFLKEPYKSQLIQSRNDSKSSESASA